LSVRVAVYYAPAPSDPLWTAAAAWLGRDAETGGTPPQPDLPGIAEVTAEPRLYGFHATLKPPMRLRASYGAFVDDARALAARLRPFALPPLAVQDLRGFLALRETQASPALQAMADACVRELDAHRVPPDEAELARRRGRGLPPAQEAMLLRWGYPHVFETWFFHMTLTRRIDAAAQAVFRPAAEAWFAPALATPRVVDALSVFTQAAAGAPFMVAERLPFGG
jgi:putative phosphonate metabolism protein